MRSILIAAGCALILQLSDCSPIQAKDKFPYTAVVDSSTIYVRSGAGEQYYPTTRLRPGDLVEVHRHDPGGWYMISPPSGSFSWIPKRYVDLVARGEGEVQEDNVVVFVGSDFGDDSSVFQRRLSPGETVKVIGEKTLNTSRGPVVMYRIKPPRREWRWIRGDSVVKKTAAEISQLRSRDKVIDQNTDRRTWKNRSQPETVENKMQGPQQNRTDDADDPSLKVAQRDGQVLNGRKLLDYLSADRRELSTIDLDFKKVVISDKSEWSFDKLEQDYRALAKKTNSPQLKRQIEMRFAALDRYRRAKKHYDEFLALTRSTNAQDDQLLLEQDRLAPDDKFVSSDTFDTPTTSKASSSRPSSEKLVGAGIIERSVAPGMPRFVLVAPGGKILAYLQASSKVDLKKYVGKSMGIKGERYFRPDISSDHIVVDSLEPVRLKKVASKPERKNQAER